MNKRLPPLSMLILTAAFSLLPRANAAGLFADQDVDPRFRAKIMKEKAKQNQQGANSFNFNNKAQPDAQCGSQDIGNVDTNGRIGAAPREVFVFAPNAINLVSANGCK